MWSAYHVEDAAEIILTDGTPRRRTRFSTRSPGRISPFLQSEQSVLLWGTDFTGICSASMLRTAGDGSRGAGRSVKEGRTWSSTNRQLPSQSSAMSKVSIAPSGAPFSASGTIRALSAMRRRPSSCEIMKRRTSAAVTACPSFAGSASSVTAARATSPTERKPAASMGTGSWPSGRKKANSGGAGGVAPTSGAAAL